MKTRKISSGIASFIAAAALSALFAAPAHAAAPTYTGWVICQNNGGGISDFYVPSDTRKKALNAMIRDHIGSDLLDCSGKKSVDDSGVKREA